MKIWAAIFNLIGLMVIAILIMVVQKIDAVSTRQFEEVRLQTAVDYSVEAAFRTAVSIDTVGTSYDKDKLNQVKITPSIVMDTFKSIMCLNYDISLSQTNFDKIDQSIPVAVLCGVDGYYVYEINELDTNTTDAVLGGEYGLIWSVKKPYLVYNSAGRLFAANILNESTIEYSSKQRVLDGNPLLEYRETFACDVGNDAGKQPTGLNREIVKAAVGTRLTEEISFAISERNRLRPLSMVNSFYMPASESLTGVNYIESPSLLILFQNASFLTGYNLNAISVGGVRVTTRTSVLGITLKSKPGIYYCYAGQQLGDPDFDSVVARYDTIQEASLKGAMPALSLLSKPIP